MNKTIGHFSLPGYGPGWLSSLDTLNFRAGNSHCDMPGRVLLCQIEQLWTAKALTGGGYTLYSNMQLVCVEETVHWRGLEVRVPQVVRP